MKGLSYFLITMFFVMVSCDKDDPIDNLITESILSNILRIEVYVTLDDSDFAISYKDGSNTFNYLSSHYIWFTSIEGNIEYVAGTNKLNCVLDANLLGSHIYGFIDLEVQGSSGNSSIIVKAQRVADNTDNTKVFEIETDLIDEMKLEMIEGKSVRTYEALGTNACDHTISTSFTNNTTSYVDALTAYNCTEGSSVKVIIYYNGEVS